MLKGTYQDNAKVVDGKLILSLPGARTPVVWQMDLSEAKTSALEVNDNDKEGFLLALKTTKGETVKIAAFDKKEQAVHALMAASKAMEKAQGQIQQGSSAKSSNSSTQKLGFGKTLLMIIGGLVVIFVLFNILISMMPKPPMSMQNSAYETGAEAPAPAPSGVPVSADEFLKRR